LDVRQRPLDREGFVTSLHIATEAVPSYDVYPYNLPVVRGLGVLKFHPAVTFLIGENGSGKSTLIEAIAIRLSFEELGGEAMVGFRNRFDHRVPDGGLHEAIRIASSPFRRPGDRFFMRAETVFDLANKLDELEREYPTGHARYGGRSLHTRSHGEAFLALVQSRMKSESLIIMDEPEAALSPTRQLTLIKEIDWLVRSGCQFIIATHSPILMAYPDCKIYELGENGIRETEYRQTEHYELTKNFLNHPEAYLRHLVE
jgi:predicted ATPase